jgi:hypothetical protein
MTKRPKNAYRGVTGRDSFIMAKALAYAIETIRRLPRDWQEFSDMTDMLKLLKANAGSNMARHYRILARMHVRRVNAVDIVNGQLRWNKAKENPGPKVVKLPRRRETTLLK